MSRTVLLAVLTSGVLAGGLVSAVALPASETGPVRAAPRVLATPSPVLSAPAAAAPAAPAPAGPAAGSPAARAQAPARRTATAPPRTVAPVRREVLQTGWRAYAVAGPLRLHFPADVVELVGLHESGHDGALPQQPTADAGRIGTLGSRARGTNGQGAADIVVHPSAQVRAPVTGTVLRAGTYTLYCDHVDEYLVVEPDARPGWEVKLLHFTGLRVAPGDRVVAGVTVVGARARVLPFASQVDEHTVAPHWPHLHLEVVDPSVPDRPSGATCD